MAPRKNFEFEHTVNIAKKVYEADARSRNYHLDGLLVISRPVREGSLIAVFERGSTPNREVDLVDYTRGLVGLAREEIASKRFSDVTPEVRQFGHLDRTSGDNNIDSDLAKLITQAQHTREIGSTAGLVELADPRYQRALAYVHDWYGDNNLAAIKTQLEGIEYSDYLRWNLSDPLPSKRREKDLFVRAWERDRFWNSGKGVYGELVRKASNKIHQMEGPSGLSSENGFRNTERVLKAFARNRVDGYSPTEVLTEGVESLDARSRHFHIINMLPAAYIDRLAAPPFLRERLMTEAFNQTYIYDSRVANVLAAEVARLVFLRQF